MLTRLIQNSRQLILPKRNEPVFLFFLVFINLQVNFGSEVVQVIGNPAFGVLRARKRQVIRKLNKNLRQPVGVWRSFAVQDLFHFLPALLITFYKSGLSHNRR